MVMVLESVISPPGEQLRYVGPTISMDPMSFEKPLFFLLSERSLVDVWSKLIAPSLSTALPYESISLSYL